MPPELFLDRFMKPLSDCARAPAVDFSKLGSVSTVRDISEALIRVVEKHKVCPTLRLFITKVKKRQVEGLSSSRNGRRDGHAYGAETTLLDSQVELCPPVVARTQRRPRRVARTKRGLAEYHDFATADLGFAVLCSQDEDPFFDPKSAPEVGNTVQGCATHAPPADATPGVLASGSALRELPNGASQERYALERNTAGAAATRSRLEAYASANFARQHRRFLFQVVIIGGQARFLRWDRSGCIVSARFSVIHTPHLADFLWRFDHMDSQQRGWDSTATLATHVETKLFEDAVRDFIGAAKASAGRKHVIREVPNAEQTLDSTDTYPTWKICVAHEDTHEVTDLVVRRPFAGHRAMFGRATRAYLALDLTTSRLVFLKDSWRVDDRRWVRPEFRTYQELRSHDIPFIPYPMYGGDVRDLDGTVQETLGQVLVAERNDWHVGTARLNGHVHHRLVQDIAYRLDSVRDERELMQAIHDALIALDRAYKELGLIHRDISSLNIMLSGDGKCLLSDWDHAGTLDQRARGVGTFQFMSTRMLISDGAEINEHVDDLESLFWVLLYIALARFAIPWDDMPFDVFAVPGPGGWHEAGEDKRYHLYDSESYNGRFKSDAFAQLLEDLEEPWGDYQLVLTDGEPTSSDLPCTPKQLKMAEAVKHPSFWIDKLADAIRRYDAEQVEAAARPPPNPLTLGPYALLAWAALRPRDSPPASGAANARVGVKRGAPIADEDAENTLEEHSPPGAADAPRRSKRLKTMHGHS
ncbi:hypothetical protein PsYK624_081700 [Phanerochaete sordida]|uniref:Protein kinase domain-containing protein n=1 Tax=Phanerochaete sordida TaxID=48140 RepID=A0A9P3GA37_9APHY|nr:hypothetical protein PsYK624_081700 [Phanerochaete sordida]